MRATAVVGVHEVPDDPGRVVVTLPGNRSLAVAADLETVVAAWTRALGSTR